MSAVKIIFIDDNYLYDNFPLPERMSRANVLSIIQLEQFTSLQDALGTCLYEHLEDAMFNQTLTADEIELMKSIKYLLATFTATSLASFMRSAGTAHTNIEARQSDQNTLDALTSTISAKSSYIQDRIFHTINNTPAILAIATADGCDDDLYRGDGTDGDAGLSGIFFPS